MSNTEILKSVQNRRTQWRRWVGFGLSTEPRKKCSEGRLKEIEKQPEKSINWTGAEEWLKALRSVR